MFWKAYDNPAEHTKYLTLFLWDIKYFDEPITQNIDINQNKIINCKQGTDENDVVQIYLFTIFKVHIKEL